MANQQDHQPDRRNFMNMHDLRKDPIPKLVTGANSQPYCPPCWPHQWYVDNPIHPLYAQKNWRTYPNPDQIYSTSSVNSCDYYDPNYHVSDFFYRAITPALRVTSLMMQKARPLLVRLVRCPQELHEGTNRFDPQWVPTADDYDFLDWCLNHLAKDAVFLRIRAQGSNIVTIAGSTCVQFDSCAAHEKGRNPLPVLTGINGDLLDEISDSDIWMAHPIQARHTILIQLALILFHELGHALWWRRTFWGEQKFNYRRTHPSTNHQQILNTIEPSVPFEVEHELGYALTDFLFQSRICLPNGAYQTVHERKNGVAAQGLRPVLDGSQGLTMVDAAGGAPYHLEHCTLHAFLNKEYWQNDNLSIRLWRPN